MDVNAKTNEVQVAANPYPYVGSFIHFMWSCSECHHLNYVNWEHWKTYGGVEECCKCEKAHNVKEPWK